MAAASSAERWGQDHRFRAWVGSWVTARRIATRIVFCIDCILHDIRNLLEVPSFFRDLSLLGGRFKNWDGWIPPRRPITGSADVVLTVRNVTGLDQKTLARQVRQCPAERVTSGGRATTTGREIPLGRSDMGNIIRENQTTARFQTGARQPSGRQPWLCDGCDPNSRKDHRKFPIRSELSETPKA